jgi:hypothetical protein
VKCLVDENLKPSLAKPTFEVRTLPDEPTIIPVSVFVFGNQWVGAFPDDDKMNFTFVIFNKANLASKAQDYFLLRWQEARALATPPKNKKSSRQKS